MRYILPLVFVASPVWAQGFTTELVGDFTGDGIPDLARLIEAGDTGEADLLMRLNGDPKDMWVERAVWIGGVGQQPSLNLTPGGSLQVISENIAIGRNRWEQVITLAWRKDQLMVAGYTYRWYDTLDLENSGICDLNFLSGKGEIVTGGNGDAEEQRAWIKLRTEGRPYFLWLYDMPEECAALFH